MCEKNPEKKIRETGFFRILPKSDNLDNFKQLLLNTLELFIKQNFSQMSSKDVHLSNFDPKNLKVVDRCGCSDFAHSSYK